MKKNNNWNIRRLIDESFVTASQWNSILYCRLTNFRTHIWVKWLSKVYRKIRPLPSVNLLFMLAWKIDFESQRHKIVWLWNKMYDFGMALETFIDTKFVKAGNNLLTFCNCNFAKWFCTFFVSLKMIYY